MAIQGLLAPQLVRFRKRFKLKVMEVMTMCFIFSLIPATIFTIIGYFVFFSSTKTEGAIQKFGRVLAIWAFIVALFFPMMGLYVTISGLCPMEEIMQTIQSGLRP